MQEALPENLSDEITEIFATSVVRALTVIGTLEEQGRYQFSAHKEYFLEVIHQLINDSEVDFEFWSGFGFRLWEVSPDVTKAYNKRVKRMYQDYGFNSII